MWTFEIWEQYREGKEKMITMWYYVYQLFKMNALLCIINKCWYKWNFKNVRKLSKSHTEVKNYIKYLKYRQYQFNLKESKLDHMEISFLTHKLEEIKIRPHKLLASLPRNSLIHSWRKYKCFQTLGKGLQWLLAELHIHVSFNSTTPLLGIYPEDTSMSTTSFIFLFY